MTTSHTIHDWSAIQGNFRDGLVLGNGASIAVDSRFGYQSLWARAQEIYSVQEDVKTIFTFLETTDFELVLRALWHAKKINEALGLSEARTAGAYETVRASLITAVRGIHPAQADVAMAVGRGIQFVGQFKTVISLSYDLILYWAMMIANSGTPNRFKDCFIKGDFLNDWQSLREPYREAAAATLVFYPHGSLVLGSDIGGAEHKIFAKDAGTLLDAVVAEWEGGRLSPLFVSEGTSAQKWRSIRRSPYLTTVCEEVLPALGDSIVIYGWSLADQDDHLVPLICRGQPKRIAISAQRDSPRLEENIARAIRKFDEHLGHKRYELVVFDANSRGAWVAA